MNREKLLDLCDGNLDAVRFIEDFWVFVQTWDDLVDKDADRSEADISGAFKWALWGVLDDPFFRQFPATLRVAITQAVASWTAANKFEKSGKRHLVEQAYFLRCSPYEVFATVVLLAAGQAKHLEAIEYFRSLAPEDSLALYMQEHLGD